MESSANRGMKKFSELPSNWTLMKVKIPEQFSAIVAQCDMVIDMAFRETDPSMVEALNKVSDELLEKLSTGNFLL
jgi:hypothetical protein